MQMLPVGLNGYTRLPTVLSAACDAVTATPTKNGHGRATVAVLAFYRWKQYLWGT